LDGYCRAIVSKAADRTLPIVPATTAADLALNSLNLATCMLSNVPGPQQPVHLAGSLLENMEFFVVSPVGLYFGIFSYNGMVSATANLDQKVGADTKALVALFPVAFEEIYQGVCGTAAGMGVNSPGH
jgi:diacylglycerol O-acyltransferase